VDNPEYVYVCYSRKNKDDLEAARWERIYLDRDKAVAWINKKNCLSKRFYFLVADQVSD